jgi:hypothetical protein
VSLDVLEEHPFRLDLADDSGNLWPQMAWIVLPSTVTGVAKWLAGITGREDLYAAAPRAAVEGSEIVPDRRRSQCLVFHPRHESGRGVTFPLDVTNSSVGGLCDMQAEIESGIAGAERQAGERPAFSIGTKIHN